MHIPDQMPKRPRAITIDDLPAVLLPEIFALAAEITSVQSLSALQNLKLLVLAGCQITDASIQSLVKMTGLG